MKAQKQLYHHDPENGIYGDCHRTAIACILDMEVLDVPHFMNGTVGKGPAPEANEAVRAWLAERGIVPIDVLYPGSCSVEDVLNAVGLQNPGVCFILGGTSRTGVNHSVVACDGKIVCDPSLTDAGIIGPMDDGYYWVTFFGDLRSKR